MVAQDALFEQIIENAKRVKDPKQMVTLNEAKGKTLIICGAGPSLALHHDFLHETFAHQVWGCNSALCYLKDHHLPVSHGFAVDQGEAMLGPEEWERTWDVQYLLASSVHPKLAHHLLTVNRRVKWFHNYLGIQNPEGWERPADWNYPDPNAGYEMWLYCNYFPTSVQTGYGLNSVVRALCLAMWMGFRHIFVVGADHACLPNSPPMPKPRTPEYTEWIRHLPLYATGRTVGTAYGDDATMVEGGINGVRFVTRADMLQSAIHLADIVRANPDRVYLVGDTLPQALVPLKPEEIALLPKLVAGGQVQGFKLHKAVQAEILSQLDSSLEESHV